jgi:hypothetical protein
MASICAGVATNGPKMQLYNDGIDQGAGVTAKYIGWNVERPLSPAFDGTWVYAHCHICIFRRHTMLPCPQHKHFLESVGLLTGFCFAQAGDVGFDPLGISELIDVKWLREAELKHGRVCMLAATGMIVQDVFKFPGVTSVFGTSLSFMSRFL